MRLLTLFLLFLAASNAAKAPLASRIRALLESSDVARGAFWGIEVDDLDARTQVIRLNERHFFVPASNTKLFTTAFALTKLGPTFQVRTLVTAAAPPDSAGRIEGDITLVGAGDANLSGRSIPYDPEAEKRDPLTVMRELALQLYTRGVRSVAGNVIGDDTAFLWEPYGPGWGVDDPTFMDGAPVSALAVNDNSISVLIQPAALTFTPPLSIFTVENRVVAGPPREIHIAREPGSSILRLWGTLPPDDPGETDALSVDDPARFAALALKSALQDQGISVAGEAQVRHLYPGEQFVSHPGIALAQHDSPSLIEDLRITAKVSQNLHAEMLLRLAGQGSRREGLKALAAFLTEAGIDPEEYSFHDGSGLSRLNVVTPHAIVELLSYMARSAIAADFASLLPIAGVDGSLRLRFAKTRAKGRVFAKTGTLSHVSALSGYATRRNGHRLAFSILVNNYNGSSADVRILIDRICGLLVE